MKKLTVIMLCLLFIVFHTFPLKASDLLYFEDFSNYESSLPAGWTLIDSDNKGTTNNFIVNNGRFGLTTNSLFSIGDAILDGYDWTDISFKFDLIAFSGVDKNVLFRWNSPDERMGFHISQNTFRIEKVIPESERLKPENLIPFPTVDLDGKVPNGMVHTFEVTLKGPQVKVRLTNDLVDEIIYDYVDQNQYIITSGTIGVRVGTGVVVPTSVWFDNIEVRSLEPEHKGLNLTHFSQIDPQWADNEYNFSSLYNQPPRTRISDWGCAISSAAMVLDYHGFTSGPEGQSINPDTVNDYLKDNDGYQPPGFLRWSHITKLAKDIRNSEHGDPGSNLLQFEYVDFDLDLLKQDLEATQPAILRLVQNGNTHFVVAHHVDENDDIFIYDPLDETFEEVSLSERYPDSQVTRIGRYFRTNSDLSYIWVYQQNPEVNLVVEHNGMKTGFDGDTVFSEIPGAIYYEELPLGHPSNFQDSYGDGSTTQVFALPQPETGEYQFSFSSETTQTAEIIFEVFDPQAQIWTGSQNPLIFANSEVTYSLEIGEDFDQMMPELDQGSSFSRLIKTILYAHQEGMITNNGARTVLLTQSLTSWKLSERFVQPARILYRTMGRFIENQHGRTITPEGYELISYEYNSLKQTLGW